MKCKQSKTKNRIHTLEYIASNQDKFTHYGICDSGINFIKSRNLARKISFLEMNFFKELKFRFNNEA